MKYIYTIEKFTGELPDTYTDVEGEVIEAAVPEAVATLQATHPDEWVALGMFETQSAAWSNMRLMCIPAGTLACVIARPMGELIPARCPVLADRVLATLGIVAMNRPSIHPLEWSKHVHALTPEEVLAVEISARLRHLGDTQSVVIDIKGRGRVIAGVLFSRLEASAEGVQVSSVQTVGVKILPESEILAGLHIPSEVIGCYR